MVHSSAACATVEGLTLELAERWRDEGIAVVAAAAGDFRTEAINTYPKSLADAAARTVPLQRLGRPEEHSWLVALLGGSPLAPAFSGSPVTLDGARDNLVRPLAAARTGR